MNLDARAEKLKEHIRDVPDFPKKGIMFKDITPLLANSQAFGSCLEMLERCRPKADIDVIAGIESRGFIFGAALAAKLHIPFVPIRKPGKLPAKTISVSYELEYGSDSLEIHEDAVKKGNRVLILDDVLATGGTAKASCELVQKLGAEVIGCCFVIELSFLEGAQKLAPQPVCSLIKY